MHLVLLTMGAYFLLTVLNVFTLVNIICVHASGCALSISAKPRSATHFPTSTTSAGLPASFGWCLCALG